MLTQEELNALVALLQRTPMSLPESLFATGLIAKLDAALKQSTTQS